MIRRGLFVCLTIGTLVGDGVSFAGDVNGDGFDDVAVSDSASGDAVQVFLGTASGLKPHPSTSIVVSGGKGQGVLIFSGAGDVNGDGFAEVIVGAPYYPTGNFGTGGALVWYGRPLTPAVIRARTVR